MILVLQVNPVSGRVVLVENEAFACVGAKCLVPKVIVILLTKILPLSVYGCQRYDVVHTFDI